MLTGRMIGLAIVDYLVQVGNGNKKGAEDFIMGKYENEIRAESGKWLANDSKTGRKSIRILHTIASIRQGLANAGVLVPTEEAGRNVWKLGEKTTVDKYIAGERLGGGRSSGESRVNEILARFAAAAAPAPVVDPEQAAE